LLVTFILVEIIPVATVVVLATHMVSALLRIIAVVGTNETVLLTLLIVVCNGGVPLPAADNITAARLLIATITKCATTLLFQLNPLINSTVIVAIAHFPPLAAVGGRTTHSDVMAVEITLQGILAAVLQFLRALI
jgi:hypothetical protein